MSKFSVNLNWIAFKTIINREVSRFMRIWSQTLVPPAITMSLYFIIFGKFVGAQIKNIDGFVYIQYIVPGLIMMAIMTNAYSNTAASFFLTKFNKSVEEFLVAPMSNVIILLGFTLGGAIRGLLVGFIVMLIALLFTHVPIHHPFITLVIAILAAMLFSLGGFINAIYAKRFDDISFVPTFVLTPLTYLGGVFFSLQQLPSFWRSIAFFNPIFNIIDAFRYGLLGITDLNIPSVFLLVSFLFVCLSVWALRLLQKGTGIKV